MIVASLASIPERRRALLRTVSSLRRQVDHTFVYLNGYTSNPFEGDPDVTGLLMDYGKGDLGACGKFYHYLPPNHPEGVLLCCDDDLIYKPGYVAKLIEGIDRYDGKVVVSLHGKIIKPPMRSYYADKETIKYHCLATIKNDHPVNVIGTGVMAFRSDLFECCPLSWNDFPQRYDEPFSNSADLLFSYACHRRSLPMITLAHHDDWIEHQQIPAYTMIYNRYYNQCEPQTRFVNERAEDWKVRDVIRTSDESTR